MRPAKVNEYSWSVEPAVLRVDLRTKAMRVFKASGGIEAVGVIDSMWKV